MLKGLDQTTVLQKLLQAKHFTDRPQIIVSDFDGSLFTPDVRILYEAFHQNKKLMKILNRKSIPLIINTGRSDWSQKIRFDARLVGVHADAVITGAGTKIYYKNLQGRFFVDTYWEKHLAKQELIINEKAYQWGYQETLDQIKKTIEIFIENNDQNLPLITKKGNPFLVRYSVKGASNNQLLDITNQLEKLFPKGVKAIFTEHLVARSFGTPTGDVLLVPTAAGKDAATKYVLETYANTIKMKIFTYCFGDGTIDLTSFLTMPKEEKLYSLQQFLVHPTPLARELFATYPTVQQPTILFQTGPTAILQTIENHLSKAQNSKIRKLFLQPTSNIIDTVYPKKLSANEISLLGIHHVITGINNLYEKKPHTKSNAIRLYLLGLFADVADGVRARKTIPSTNGQLVDVFSDRMREFYQLYKRGLHRLEKNPEEALITLEAAISCFLPSLARSQAEIMGQTVQENAKGASFWRTKKLFLSLLNDVFLKNQKKSFAIDRDILETSLDNYRIRMKHTAGFSLEKIEKDKLTDFQKKALERWLLLIQLLEESIFLIKKTLANEKKKHLLMWLKTNKIEQLEKIDLIKERKRFGFSDNMLSLKKYCK